MNKANLIILLTLTACVAFASPQDRKVGAFTTTKYIRRTRLTTKSDSTPQTFEANCTLEFEAFKVKYNRNYLTKDEEARRKVIFCKTLKEIYDHNANKSASFQMAINGESDKEQSKNPKANGLKVDEKSVKSAMGSYKVKQMPPINETQSKKVRGSYLNLGPLTGPVKDQGGCGGCWAYASSAVVQYDAWKTGKINVTLSEQDPIDCNEFQGGCDGASPIAGLAYAYLHGQAEQSKYPYRQKKGTCKRPNAKIPSRWQPKNVCQGMMKGDDSQYAAVIDQYGAVLIAIAFNGKIQSYSGGIYDDAASCGTDVNHGVTLVGYGTDPQKGDYYIVKNSWGPTYGEGGYFRIKAKVNMCGIGYGVWVVCA